MRQPEALSAGMIRTPHRPGDRQSSRGGNDGSARFCAGEERGWKAAPEVKPRASLPRSSASRYWKSAESWPMSR